jgi:hypothetical protein
MDYNEVLERAMKIAKERQPEASPQKQAAFANAVAEAVTGWSSGYGGPSVREHAAGRACRHPKEFDVAVEILINNSGPIFGPLTDVHTQCWRDEFCFDDDPQDILILGGGS